MHSAAQHRAHEDTLRGRCELTRGVAKKREPRFKASATGRSGAVGMTLRGRSSRSPQALFLRVNISTLHLSPYINKFKDVEEGNLFLLKPFIKELGLNSGRSREVKMLMQHGSLEWHHAKRSHQTNQRFFVTFATESTSSCVCPQR
jgi:hypothetical protein